MFTVKTQRKLQNIHSLSIAMLPVVAANRGFNGQWVTLITKTDVFPALLVLDKKLKENIAIIAESKFSLSFFLNAVVIIHSNS